MFNINLSIANFAIWRQHWILTTFIKFCHLMSVLNIDLYIVPTKSIIYSPRISNTRPGPRSADRCDESL